MSSNAAAITPSAISPTATAPSASTPSASTPAAANAAPVPKAKSFTLTQGGTVETILGRQKAVTAAKVLSAESRQRVSVSRDDGLVSMQFRDGSLETFAFQTHRG